MALLLDAHFWVGVALMVFLGILAWAGVHKFAWKALGDAGAKVQAQLDEANALRSRKPRSTDYDIDAIMKSAGL